MFVQIFKLRVGNAVLLRKLTKRSSTGTGNVRNIDASRNVKIAVFAPMPRARQAIAAVVNPGLFRRGLERYNEGPGAQSVEPRPTRRSRFLLDLVYYTIVESDAR
jgi:hypothetical protein